ncbi:MAG: hypothetical protein ACQESG_05330 [Nanobdellota archaeon]
MKYIAMTQQRYCCLPTCLQMILSRRGIPLLEQEEIGIDLGLIVPPEEAENFANVPKGEEPPAGWGTRINLERYSLNSFFRKRSIPLSSEFYEIKDLEDLRTFITHHLSQGNDRLTAFNYHALYGEPSAGHASLIESIEGDTITLVDPQVGRKRKTVSSAKLRKATEVHYDGESPLGGSWVIR